MAGLNDLLYLSGTGLQAYQNQITVYSNNIANVGTKDYSRRRLDLETVVWNGELGGVRSGDVLRMYKTLGSATLLQEESSASYHAAQAGYLSGLEQLVGGGSLDSAVRDFQNALQDAIASPENMAARSTLLQRAATLTSEINRIDATLAGAINDDNSLFGSASGLVDEINLITEQLQTLNRNITRAEVMGRSVPDLLDERDKFVRDLSQIVNISVSPDYQISFGGQELVSADGLVRAEWAVDAANVFTVDGVDVGSSISGGKLAAWIVAKDTAESLRGQIDSFASVLIAETNAIFNTAYNLQGERPADLGYTFFSGTLAGDIAVDAALYDPSNPMNSHPELVALAASANPGDNAAGQALYDMLQVPQSALGEQSLTGFWVQVETTLASAVQEERQLANSGQMVVSMLNDQMLSVSGVNLDEELMNLMGAQKAYEACARVMTTANELLETLINIAG